LICLFLFRKKSALSIPNKSSHFLSPLNSAKVDIILRSSDGVIFRVRRLHLQSGSTVFDDMLSSPDIGTIGEKVNGLAVVDFTESGRELKVFLSVLIPSEGQEKQIEIENIMTSVYASPSPLACSESLACGLKAFSSL
jgi:hypothetical protein